MFNELPTFVKIVFVFIVAEAPVAIFFYFKIKRSVELSDFEKDLWRLKHLSYSFIAIIAAAAVFAPLGSFYHDIDLARTSADAAVRELVANQQKMGNELREFRSVWAFVMLALMAYVANVAGIINRLQKEKRKHNLLQDPALRKPLGLDTDPDSQTAR